MNLLIQLVYDWTIFITNKRKCYKSEIQKVFKNLNKT